GRALCHCRWCIGKFLRISLGTAAGRGVHPPAAARSERLAGALATALVDRSRWVATAVVRRSEARAWGWCYVSGIGFEAIGENEGRRLVGLRGGRQLRLPG